MTIPDGGGFADLAQSGIALSCPCAVSDVNVKVTIPHTYSGDLTLRLRSPSGNIQFLDCTHKLQDCGSGTCIYGTSAQNIFTGTILCNCIFNLMHDFNPLSLSDTTRKFVHVNGARSTLLETIFDQQAAVGIETVKTYPLTGTYKPFSGNLGALNGEMMTGTWTLLVSDHCGDNIGTIQQWCIQATCAG